MSEKIKKKIRTISLIYLISGLVFCLGGYYYSITSQDKWEVITGIDSNRKIQERMHILNVKLHEEGYVISKNNILEGIAELVKSKNNEILNSGALGFNIVDLVTTEGFIRFKTNDINNIDNKIRKVVLKLNKDIQFYLNYSINTILERVADDVMIGLTRDIERLKISRNNAQKIVDRKQNNSEELKLILFNIFSKELIDTTLNDSDFDFGNLDNLDIILYLDIIISQKEERLNKLINSPSNIKLTNFNYHKLILELDNINENYLKINSIGKFNRKPITSYIIIGAIIMSLIISTLISLIVIFSKSLTKAINKKLITL